MCQAAGVGRRCCGASRCGNVFDQVSRLGVDHVQVPQAVAATVANVGAVVVARGNQGNPARSGLDEERLTKGIAHIERCSRALDSCSDAIGELPQDLARDRCFARRTRCRHVKCEIATTALSKPANQNGVPIGTAEINVCCCGCAIDIVFVAEAYLQTQIVQVGHDQVGHIGPRLGPGSGVESVQHAIVGALVEHSGTAGVGRLEGAVPRIHVVGLGHIHHHSLAVDDVAQQVPPRAVACRFARPIATQIGQHCSAVGERRRRTKQGFLRRAQLGGGGCRSRLELDTTDSTGHIGRGCDETTGGCAQIQLRGGRPGSPQRRGGFGTGGHVKGEGVQIAGPGA